MESVRSVAYFKVLLSIHFVCVNCFNANAIFNFHFEFPHILSNQSSTALSRCAIKFEFLMRKNLCQLESLPFSLINFLAFSTCLLTHIAGGSTAVNPNTNVFEKHHEGIQRYHIEGAKSVHNLA